MTDEAPGPDHNGQVKSFVERIERLNQEKADIVEDIKEVFAEAKGSGLDTKILRKLIAERKRDANEMAEEEAILDLYRRALA